MARQSLGRGLSELLGGDGTADAGTNAITEVDITLVDPNPEQPRTRFTDEALDELARSITSNGIVQPIVVRPRHGRYQIVAGERRWRAAQRAGLRKIPVTVKEVADDKLLEVALIENIQRQELNPIEEAKAYRRLIDTIGLTQEQVSERVGKERSLIATSLRLLKLPLEVLKNIEEGKLSAGHGRALLMVDNAVLQTLVSREAIAKGLSVRETEKTVKIVERETNPSSKSGSRKKTKDPNISHAEVKLMRALGTNVAIKPAKGGVGGKIEIEYYSIDDLDRIYEALKGNKEG
jgi:ParB family chromosome partitioning protein